MKSDVVLHAYCDANQSTTATVARMYISLLTLSGGITINIEGPIEARQIKHCISLFQSS